MHFFRSLIVFLTLLASIRMDDGDPAPLKAKVTVSLGKPRLFSGEDVELTCSIPGDPSPSWTHQWFHAGFLLSSTEVYSLKKAQVWQSGNYACQGHKTIEAWPYTASSNRSDPLEINVDGGWIILQTPFEPLLVDETVTLTCRVRDDPFLSEVILYKDGVEVRKQKDKDLVFPNLKLEDGGLYSCRASWFKDLEYHSAQSLPSSVTVLDKLDTPRLELLTKKTSLRIGNEVVFRCITKLNVKEQGLEMEYYYIKDGNRLGPASTEDTYTISRASQNDNGVYTCKVRVRVLDVERWSNELQLKLLAPLNI